MNLYYSVPLNRLVDSAGNPLQAVPRLAYGDILPVIFTALDADNTPVDLSLATKWKLTVAVDREEAAKPVLEVLDITYDPVAKTLSFTIDSKTPEFFMAVNGKSQVVLLTGLCGSDADDAPLFPFLWDMTGAMPCGGGGVPEFVDNSIAIHNKSDEAHAALFAAKADAAEVESALTLKADLVNGRVPAHQLPGGSYPIVEAATLGDLPETGDASTIYITLDTNKSYRWSGSQYVEISASLVLGETDQTAFAGNRGVALEAALPDKVDKEEGKSLIAETEITRLAEVDNYDDNELRQKLAAKATPADISFAVRVHDDADDAHAELFAAKVDAEEGKSLLADTEITRLAGVDNYDDTELRGELTAKLPLTGGTMTGQLVLSTADGIRHKYNNYGVIYRNDGANYYMMVTAQGDPNGSGSSARPFTLNLATGVLNINGSAVSAINDSAGNNISSTYAQASKFVQLNSMTESETVYVGSTRTYKTVVSALDYVKTKQVSKNRYIIISIDAGSYSETGLYLNYVYVRLKATDASNRPIINIAGNFNVTRQAYLGLYDLVLNFTGASGLAVYRNALLEVENTTFHLLASSTTTAAVSLQANCTAIITNCTFTNNSTTAGSRGISVTECSYAYVNGGMITGFYYPISASGSAYVNVNGTQIYAANGTPLTSGYNAISANYSSYIFVTGGMITGPYNNAILADYGSTVHITGNANGSIIINNCTIGIRSTNGSIIRAVTANIIFRNDVTTLYSPAAGVIGNNNSMIVAS